MPLVWAARDLVSTLRRKVRRYLGVNERAGGVVDGARRWVSSRHYETSSVMCCESVYGGVTYRHAKKKELTYIRNHRDGGVLWSIGHERC